jgi:hypothetical protein
VGDVTAARLGTLPARPAGVEVADGLDEHVPLVDELEHDTLSTRNPAIPSSDTDDEEEAEDVA